MSTYTNLVFQGGGVKGIAYAGALQVLESRGILAQIERVAGTSAGAITACLVSLNYDAAYITKTIKTLNFKSFEDKEWIWKKYWYYGFHLGDYGILATDFNLSEAMKDKLIESGITYTEKFLDHRN